MAPRGGRGPQGLVLSGDDLTGVAARAVVRFHLRAFARAEGQARAGEVEPVHQLRVATRRLRATLHLLAPVLPGRFTERAGREIAWLGGAIGAVRDLDVLNAVVAPRASRLDPELRSALGPVALAIHDQRAAAHAALVAALDSNRCRRLLDGLAAFAASPPPARRGDALGTIAPELVRPHLRAMVRAGRRIAEDSSPEVLHRLRVRVKRLRYALETLHGLGGKSLGRLVRKLERMQDVLGEHQDAVTVVRWLRTNAESAELPPATLLASGALIHAVGRRARRLRRRFPERWRRVDRRRLLGGVMAELARPVSGRGDGVRPLQAAS